jgi:uncharacterized protein (DUF885 family)
LSTAAKNPAALSSSESALLSHTDAASILKTLRSQITSDFPAIKAQTCHIRSVDSSLENYLSPAFYLTPPIDEKTAQVIYINRAEKYRRSGLFNTLAHEGYPGHLYQNCYMREKNLPELRYVLDFPGYTEGYATYAEIYSYRYLDASEDEIAILQNNAIASLCLYTLADIGIHYRHWNTTQLSSFLQSHGVYGDDSAHHRLSGKLSSLHRRLSGNHKAEK